MWRRTRPGKRSLSRASARRSGCPALSRTSDPRVSTPSNRLTWKFSFSFGLFKCLGRGSLRLEYAQDRPMQPGKTNRGEEQEDHEHRLMDPGPRDEIPEDRRQKESTQGTEEPDLSPNRPHVIREILRNILVDGSLSDPHRHTDHKDERDE